MHLGLGLGDVSNRILTVGHPARADMFAQLLDAGSIRLHQVSSRGFVTYTGTYHGVEVSIVSIGMGLPMMDFFVREVRSVIPKGTEIYIIRIGTCGGLQRDISPGTIAVAKEGGILVRRNYDSFLDANHIDNHEEKNEDSSSVDIKTPLCQKYYTTSNVCPSDESLTNTFIHYLGKIPHVTITTGLNISGESFYSTQGRIDSNFIDNNEGLLEHVCSNHPSAVSMEMETFQLLHLAACAKDTANGGAGRIHATAAAVILINRYTREVIQEDICHLAEKNAGICALKTLIHQTL